MMKQSGAGGRFARLQATAINNDSSTRACACQDASATARQSSQHLLPHQSRKPPSATRRRILECAPNAPCTSLATAWRVRSFLSLPQVVNLFIYLI